MSMTVSPETTPTLVDEGADLLALVELALGEARALGASQSEVAVSMDTQGVADYLGEVLAAR